MTMTILAMVKRVGMGWKPVMWEGTDDDAMVLLDAKRLDDLTVRFQGTRHVMLFDRDGEAKGKPFAGTIGDRRIYGDVMLIDVDIDGEPVDVSILTAVNLEGKRA